MVAVHRPRGDRTREQSRAANNQGGMKPEAYADGLVAATKRVKRDARARSVPPWVPPLAEETAYLQGCPNPGGPTRQASPFCCARRPPSPPVAPKASSVP